MDRIVLEGVAFIGRHGVLEKERRIGRRFAVDLELELDLAEAGRTDNLQDTFDYSHAHAIARQVIEGKPVNLLETLAAKIADRLLAEHPKLEAVSVKVSKHPPLEGSVKLAAVLIRRTRKKE